MTHHNVNNVAHISVVTPRTFFEILTTSKESPPLSVHFTHLTGGEDPYVVNSKCASCSALSVVASYGIIDGQQEFMDT